MEENKEDWFELSNDHSTSKDATALVSSSDKTDDTPLQTAKSPVRLTNKKNVSDIEEKGKHSEMDSVAACTNPEPGKNHFENSHKPNEKKGKNSGAGVHCTVKPSEHGEQSPGHILRDARNKKGMSIEQVSASTKIVKHYIQMIEQDDYSTLPSPVFVTAYIKSLCELYGIKEKEPLILQKLEVNQKIRPVPDKILETIHKGRQVNMEAEKKAKLLIIGILLVLALAIGLVVFLLFNFKNLREKNLFRRNAEIQKNGIPPRAESESPPNPALSSEAYQANSEKIRTNFTYPQFITQDELPITEKSAKK